MTNQLFIFSSVPVADLKVLEKEINDFFKNSLFKYKFDQLFIKYEDSLYVFENNRIKSFTVPSEILEETKIKSKEYEKQHV